MTKKSTKIAASIALFAILWSVFWTGILIVFQTLNAPTSNKQELTQEQINELFKTVSWATNTWSENILTWKTLTWTTK